MKKSKQLLLPLLLLLLFSCESKEEKSNPKEAPTSPVRTSDSTLEKQQSEEQKESEEKSPKEAKSLETPQELCHKYQKNCGTLTLIDSVGNEQSVTCGECEPEEECIDGRRTRKGREIIPHSYKELLTALDRGDPSIINYLLKQNISLATEDENKRSPLKILLLQKNSKELQSFFKKHNITLSHKDHTLLSPLFSEYERKGITQEERDDIFPKIKLIVDQLPPLTEIYETTTYGKKEDFLKLYLHRLSSYYRSEEALAIVTLYKEKGLSFLDEKGVLPFNTWDDLVAPKWKEEHIDSLLTLLPPLNTQTINGQEYRFLKELLWDKSLPLFKKIYPTFDLSFQEDSSKSLFAYALKLYRNGPVFPYLIEKNAPINGQKPTAELVAPLFQKAFKFSKEAPDLYYSIAKNDTDKILAALEKVQNDTIKKELILYGLTYKNELIANYFLNDPVMDSIPLNKMWYKACEAQNMGYISKLIKRSKLFPNKKENDLSLYYLVEYLSTEDIKKLFTSPDMTYGDPRTNDLNDILIADQVEEVFDIFYAIPFFAGETKYDSTRVLDRLFKQMFRKDWKGEFSFLYDKAPAVARTELGLSAALAWGGVTETKKALALGIDPLKKREVDYFPQGNGLVFVQGDDFREKIDLLLQAAPTIIDTLMTYDTLIAYDRWEVLSYLVEEKNIYVTHREPEKLLKKLYTPLLYRGTDSLFANFTSYSPEDMGLTNYAEMFVDACSQGYLYTAQKLLEQKQASINSINQFGETALYKAALNGQLTMVIWLLNKGADYTIKTASQRTPYMAAYEGWYPPIMEQLKRVGATPEQKPLFDKLYPIPTTNVYGHKATAVMNKEGDIVFRDTIQPNAPFSSEAFSQYTRNKKSEKDSASYLEYMDLNGTPIISIKKPYASSSWGFVDGLAYYKDSNEVFIVMNRRGEKLHKHGWAVAAYSDHYSQGFLTLRNSNHYTSSRKIIDKRGRLLPIYGYYSIASKVANGWFAAGTRYKYEYTYLSPRGKELFSHKSVSGEITHAFPFQSGLAYLSVNRSNKYFKKVVNRAGKIGRVNYTQVKNATEGFMAVQTESSSGYNSNRKKIWTWHFIDTAFTPLSRDTYYDASPFSEGLAAVASEETKKWGFIDTTGDTIIPFTYNRVEDFSCGMAAVEEYGSWGFINNKGEKIISAVYTSVEPFDHNGIALVSLVDPQEYKEYQKKLAQYEDDEYGGEYEYSGTVHKAYIRKNGSYLYASNPKVFGLNDNLKPLH